MPWRRAEQDAQHSFTASCAAQDAKITLVWTDPPGNPAAGVKL